MRSGSKVRWQQVRKAFGSVLAHMGCTQEMRSDVMCASLVVALYWSASGLPQSRCSSAKCDNGIHPAGLLSRCTELICVKARSKPVQNVTIIILAPRLRPGPVCLESATLFWQGGEASFAWWDSRSGDSPALTVANLG